MVDYCDECRNYIIGHKKLPSIGGNGSFISQYNCKLNHRITKYHNERMIPYTRKHICGDFRTK